MERLTEMIQSQINSVLMRIEEEEKQSTYSDNENRVAPYQQIS